jgi:hypothetical protein
MKIQLANPTAPSTLLLSRSPTKLSPANPLPTKPSRHNIKVGRFFSMQQGRVGQYLSPRVLLVRKPFRHQVIERCYIGFDDLSRARKFTRAIALRNCYFRLEKSQVMPQRYEIEIFNPGEMTRILAFWDRQSKPVVDFDADFRNDVSNRSNDDSSDSCNDIKAA